MCVSIVARRKTAEACSRVACAPEVRAPILSDYWSVLASGELLGVLISAILLSSKTFCQPIAQQFPSASVDHSPRHLRNRSNRLAGVDKVEGF